MGFPPIKIKFHKMGNWLFNPPLYVKVKEINITTITMKISTETGDEFPIKDNVVICNLHFRPRPFLV